MKLTKNAYSPASLAKELDDVISAKSIRRYIERGLLKAHRFGGKNLIIKRDDAEKWLNELPSAKVRTNYHGLAAKRARSRKTKTVSEIAEETLARQRRRLAK